MRQSSYLKLKNDPHQYAIRRLKDNEYRRQRYWRDVEYKNCRNAQARQHYQENRGKIIGQVTQRYFREKETILTQKHHSRREKERSLRTQILSGLGDRCVRCGFSDVRALQIDHVNGGGVKERKRFTHVTRYYKHILANLSQYQCLCANCNWIKRIENKEFLRSKYGDMSEVQ